jgi:hypothetical protein
MKIGHTLTNLTDAEQAEVYNRGIANISSKSILSLASRWLRYSFQLLSSSARASLKDGTVLPTLTTPTNYTAVTSRICFAVSTFQWQE